MEKEFVPYELALRMKGLGFDEPCFAYYDGNHNLQYMFNGKPEKFTERRMGVSDSVWVGWISAPTFSQAFRWFREKGYRYTISSDLYEKNGRFYFDTWTDGLIVSMFESGFKYTTYEKSEIKCLEKLIEIVEQQKRA